MADNTYPTDTIARMRALIERRIAAFDGLTLATDPTALADLAPVWFADLVIVLDRAFVDRARDVERRDGTPLTEVRALVSSLLEHDGCFTPDPALGLDPAGSVLGLEPGATIRLDRDGFARLQEAFFSELSMKYALA